MRLTTAKVTSIAQAKKVESRQPICRKLQSVVMQLSTCKVPGEGHWDVYLCSAWPTLRIRSAITQFSQEAIKVSLFCGQGGLRGEPHYRTQDD